LKSSRQRVFLLCREEKYDKWILATRQVGVTSGYAPQDKWVS